MNTSELIADIKQRHSHSEFKIYLKEKYSNQMIVANQGGMWKISAEFIAMLTTLLSQQKIILCDVYDNPVEVEIQPLLQACTDRYTTVMRCWLNEQTAGWSNR